MRRRIAALVMFALAPFGARAIAATQEPAPAPASEESELDRLLRLAREGKPVVRPQAAQRFVALGAPAVERLLAETEGGPEALAELGPELTEAMGGIAEPKLRERLWRALADPDFPWRPQAARGLAAAATSEDAERFDARLDDPLAAVREAAIQGLFQLDHRASAERVRARLADPNDRVRRAAAVALFRWGEPCTVAWIVEELARDDRFFELQTGKLARYEALKLLEGQLTGKLRKNFGFDAEKPSTDPANAEAQRAIEEYAHRLCADFPELPAVARSGSATEGDLIGLEVRSCRKGEYFLRWNAKDVLYVGTNNPVAIPLEPGTVARLMELARRELESLGKERLWGSPGCDLEQIDWRSEASARTASYRISKGQRQVEGLRPESIAALEEALLATVPESGEDPRVENLRAQLSDALRAVGGPLASD